jgi:hypothetical protein
VGQVAVLRYRYRNVKLPDGTTRLEHRLVMERHLGRRLRRDEVVHHKNGDGHDNGLSNLEVMPVSEHARRHRLGQPGHRPSPQTVARLSRINSGSKHPQAKLTEARVRAMRAEFASGSTMKGIAERYGLHRAYVSQIVRRKRWSHI